MKGMMIIEKLNPSPQPGERQASATPPIELQMYITL
jgi:hypothetical protein